MIRFLLLAVLLAVTGCTDNAKPTSAAPPTQPTAIPKGVDPKKAALPE